MEKGLSANTLLAYRHDLEAFAGWLAPRGLALDAADRAAILDYLADGLRAGKSARSAARQLSCLRNFYRHLLREGRIAADPTLQVQSPRIGRALPRSLGEDDVDSLLAAPDTATAIGLRDRVRAVACS